MGVHNNFHAPKESWPAFAWYAIEFFVVMAVGVLVADISMDYFHKLGFTEDMTNWIFWGIAGIPFLAYYIVVRPLLLKKPALKI